jgi:hypothetical protein
MERGRAQYLFIDEAPNLIFDEEPEMVAYRQHMRENGDWEYLNARQPEHLQRLESLHWTLMKLPATRRRKEARRDPYRDSELANCLLKESEKDLVHAIPEAADERARTAEWIADALLRASFEDVSSIRARARTLRAAVRQLVGQPRESDLLFRSALDALAECPHPLAWACFFRTLARVREQQRRIDEAAAFLSRAHELYCQGGGAYDDRQWCLRRLGRLYLALNDPGRAMEALARFELEGASEHARAEVLLGMAACLAAVELHEPARLLLRQSRTRRRWIPSREHRLPLEWWDARILLRLGDLEDAIPRLDGVRRALLDFKFWADACSASVELLLAYARTGTRERKSRPDVFGELAQAFQKSREPFIFVRFDFLPFAEDREPLEAALRDAAELLETRRVSEAAACRTFLEHVRSMPPSLRAAEIRRQAGWGCPWRRRKRPKLGSSVESRVVPWPPFRRFPCRAEAEREQSRIRPGGGGIRDCC